MRGRAGRAEGRAVVRLLQTAQYLAADAGRRLERLDGTDIEAALRVPGRKFPSQPKSTLGDGADPAPLPVADLESRPDERAGGLVPVAAHHPRILVLHCRLAGLELTHGSEHAVEEIERLESRDHDGHAVVPGDRLVLAIAHDRADVSGPEKATDAIAG